MEIESKNLNLKAERFSMLMSAFIMGLGQIYNKYILKGVIFFLVELLFISNFGKIFHSKG